MRIAQGTCTNLEKPSCLDAHVYQTSRWYRPDVESPSRYRWAAAAPSKQAASPACLAAAAAFFLAAFLLGVVVAAVVVPGAAKRAAKIAKSSFSTAPAMEEASPHT
mmetsp:Transcript_19665/g.50999  ORF Transcript_19665/g.50999 Transcript_19665/m.50999 type:complete len:106 (-) Transcript_19665:2511-2828(-)|eukprot:CAMPEP_0202355668 /NCGR_PEP_ID=MMETSP1126-20121109/10463_1 /ASSEMBLY_ACC=CAM_ASM_000457 /TAXON_ID=3047 /ORGANISM="Dunaliella tertiolecta, Strain CCMP1320" /LENGTH=105 /DNA_ID=CAMNT_0048948315 /DNA_START=678 /DNA_END=995 /DNA_ORIENTATION=-